MNLIRLVRKILSVPLALAAIGLMSLAVFVAPKPKNNRKAVKLPAYEDTP